MATDFKMLDVACRPYARHYSEKGFWDKVKRYGRKLRRAGLRHALVLYYTLQEPSVPTWAKTVVLGALGYLIFPLDAIPDFIPVVGLTDDLGIILAALATLELHIPRSAREKADAKMRAWFGA